MSNLDINELCLILHETLQIGDRGRQLNSDTGLLGSIPEFDSMAVVSVITAIEDNYGIIIEDDEVSAELFETVGTLFDFISKKSV